MKYRHHPFEITPQRAEAWLHCMKEAFIEAGLDQKEAGSLLFYIRLKQVTAIMVNSN